MYLKFCIGPYKPTHIKHTGYISGSNPVKQRKFPWPLTWTSAAWSSSPSGREKLNLIVVSTLSGPSTLCSDWTSHVLPTRIIMSRVTTLVNESFCEPNIRVSSSQLELKFTLKKSDYSILETLATMSHYVSIYQLTNYICTMFLATES